MDTHVLEDIGLTNAEIKVYLALLELGSSRVGPIIEKSGLQSSVVHSTLSRLIDRGFVSFVKEGKISQYQASNPKHIVDYIDEKKKRFESLLPELLSRQQMARVKPEVTAFRGIRGIKEMLYELLEAGGHEHHTLGSPKESVMLGDAFWISYHRKRAGKGIRARQIFNESLRGWVKKVKYRMAEVSYRYTEKGFEPLTEVIVRNDMVGIIIWVEKPMGVLIHHKTVAESYDKFFELMWKAAKP